MSQDRIDLINERLSNLDFLISDSQSKANQNINGDKYQGYLDLITQYLEIKYALEQEKITLTS